MIAVLLRSGGGREPVTCPVSLGHHFAGGAGGGALR